MIIVSVVVVRADVYDLLELPSVRHGRQHLSDFGLFELNHPIDPFNVLENVYYMRIVERDVGKRVRRSFIPESFVDRRDHECAL